ncbi:helix-turn-helix domain-containing protein [Actinacidiphila bryophytorum]|uniref:helix-turn-helix domain-containing protein n=1 Tax=Actinacidiphila bryophytorum TaxID=1436133 RepID=UPI002176C3D1|nr:helix-turn-helix domain-containing protein [Actinacidiphila bryophytorum]UWE08733.1 helix-turn-helix domain-containing protein [Actinacidiphila bryophytorum]
MDDSSFLSRLADDLEARQLGMAKDLQAYVDSAMDGDSPSETELRGMVAQLSQALRDARRVAESRGDRLPAPEQDSATAAADAAMRREIAGSRDDMAGAGPAPGEELPGLVVRRWPNEPACVGGARRILRLYLHRWGMESLTDTAVLVMSELLGNAVQHATGAEDSLIETRFERLADGSLRIEVHDSSENTPRRRDASADAEAGRGLALVDALTGGRWGVADRSGIGKRVWALCNLNSPGQTPVHPPGARKRERPRKLGQEPAAVTWARERAGLTKRDLADLVGVSEQLVGEIESGWRSATPVNLVKIAAVLDCPVVVLERKGAEDSSAVPPRPAG